MNKIQAIGIEQSQMKMMQEMQRMAALSGSSMTPTASMSIGSQIGAPSFSQALNQAIDNVNSLQNSASAKQTAYEMGLNDDLTGTMLESQKASVSFSAMIQTRNKLTSALDELINTPL